MNATSTHGDIDSTEAPSVDRCDSQSLAERFLDNTGPIKELTDSAQNELKETSNIKELNEFKETSEEFNTPELMQIFQDCMEHPDPRVISLALRLCSAWVQVSPNAFKIMMQEYPGLPRRWILSLQSQDPQVLYGALEALANVWSCSAAKQW